MIAATPAASPSADTDPAGNRVKRVATLLLVLMTIIFVIATLIERSVPWFGFVRATAEAAMIGALADWFAVTALFRYPLGIKIPHTAVIPNRKDQIGRALGTFVQTNFLTPQNIIDRIAAAEPAQHLGRWLEDPQHVSEVGRQASEGMAAVVASLDDDELGPALAELVVERLNSVEVAPLAARAVTAATKEGRHQDLVDAALPYVISAIETNKRALLDAIAATSPWWVPRSVDEVVMQKAVEVVERFLGDVQRDRSHAFRDHINTLAESLSDRLANDPDMAVRANELREEILDNPGVRTYLDGLWEGTKESMLAQADDPESQLRQRIESAITDFGLSLRTDPELRRRLDTWFERIVSEVVLRFEGEISSLVTSTVDRWDATETSNQLEALIGRDLQYIRISGTVVGGMAGLAIYTVLRLIA